ncbi:MAG: HAMP domain-containing histidine kinase [Ruminococcaceae bacterium]|nr:HAMP domain-containing histidine kinase [Oscillospiraceae bacterium]
MKLSFKFFCIAYIVVLLSTGLGGAYIIKNINDTLWNTQVERVNAAVNYAADSFMAFADVSYNEISGSQKNDAIRQIKNTMDSSVSDIEIYTSGKVNSQYTEMEDNECTATFVKEENRLMMESVCKLNIGSTDYYLFVYSDFTDIQNQRDVFWNRYGFVVICVSVVSGLLLFALARKITKPLNKLTKVADEIALGNYGKRVEVKSSDYEISALSESVNSMSSAIEQKIKEIQDELEKRNIFVADFTHEMKTPMTAIIGYAQMLQSYDLDDTEKDEAAKAIWDEAKRLEKLSLQLLELYVYQNENVEMESLDLFEVGKQLNTTLKYLSEKYEINYTIDFEKVIVSANSVLLLSLLYNLADNALKASNPQTSIKIYSKTTPIAVQIYVEDKGRGVAKENIRLLTEPFYREDKSRSRKLGGAGLGLSLCKEIARIHGTELDFESEKDKGTTVSFSLYKGGAE